MTEATIDKVAMELISKEIANSREDPRIAYARITAFSDFANKMKAEMDLAVEEKT